MSFGNLLLNRDGSSVKPTSRALQSSSGTVESLRFYSMVGFHAWEGERITHNTLGRISFFDGDSGACYIGLKRPISLTLLAYDL